MRTVRWIAIALAFGLMLYYCALPGDLPAETDRGPGLAGTYTTNGIDPTGSEFGGTAVFAATDDPDVYDLQLVITGSIQVGRADVRGDTIAVTWETVAAAGDDPLSGTGDYRIDPDGVIRGTWRVNGSSDEGTIELYAEP